ncbi:hypothetical protein LU290_05025 [Moraxella nasibovis]|uniref:hypothetical protein n=1 Tax=Moraxella nasibovis TaxID=2904120 RepID=UPI00240F1727|nr:hypothetical protein [Moraxella nasibovis]WFF39583.1 hypothetical protein LU290_05025 [Moraxella nasibovis]
MQIEIFRAGKRLDAHGNEFDITVENLQQVVDSYNPAYHEAPIVIGHPKMNTPAYAWVESVSLDGETLKATLKQIDPEFGELVKSGKYKKVSASFYTPDSPSNPVKGSWSLRHVGFLGAMPPAVKGLKEPIFGDDETGVIDFTEEPQADKPSDEPSPSDDGKPDAQPNPQPNHPIKGEDVMTDDDKKELEALRAENARLKAEKLTAMMQAKQADNASFAEKLITDGKLAPVVKDKALDLLNSALSEDMAKQGNPEFNENDGMVAKVKDFLAALPTVVDMGEFAKGATAGGNRGGHSGGLSHHERACALMKAENISYEEAARLTA